MPVYLTLLSVLVLQMAACRPRPVTSHVSSTRSCPVCRGVRGSKVSSLRPSLAAGEPCGVYTPSCFQGFKCTPVEDDPRPLQALLEGRGICIAATAARISPTKRIHTVGPTRSEAPQKAPCLRLLVEIVKGLNSQLFQSHHDIYMPNCDRHGFFIQKQCRSSRGMQRGSCWCVDENGKQAASHTKHDGTLKVLSDLDKCPMASPSANRNLNIRTYKTKKKKQFVQQRVKVFRASEPVLSVFSWGVNHTINDLSQVPGPVMLLPDDFKASTKIKVSNHLFNKENLPGQFKFKEYCPQVFRNLRERFGIQDQHYQASLACRPPCKNSEGQDVGPLLTSFDRTLVVKEISSEEVEDMHNILSEYHQHIVTCNSRTLLPQFLGMYRATVENEDTYLLVMRNMFSHRLHVHRKYDLKGSLVSREASFKERVKELPTYKDVDFRNNMQKIYVSDRDKDVIMDKLNKDIEFLVRMRIMDYSLLLGIHDVRRAEWEGEEHETEEASCEEEDEDEEGPAAPAPACGASPEGLAAHANAPHHPAGPGEFNTDVYAILSAAGAPQEEVYFMGLINVLTQYDAKKKAAHAAKTVKHGAGAEISTVHPEQYAKRFRRFIAKIVA